MQARLLLVASLLTTAAAASPERPPPSDWSIAFGGGALAMPSYPGAASLRVLPLPFFDVRYRDVFFASPVAGIGVNAPAVEKGRFGIAVAPEFGRSASAADRLRGFGDVSAGATLRAFGTYPLGPVALVADVRRQVGAANGTLADAGVTTTMPVARRLIVSATATLTWGDARYMQAYFGTAAVQSSPALLQGLSVQSYTPREGLRDTAFSLLAIVPLDAHWAVQSLFRAEVLLGSAAQSPVTEQRFQPTFGGFVAYRL